MHGVIDARCHHWCAVSLTVRSVNNVKWVIIDPATVDLLTQELLVTKWVVIGTNAAKPRCFLGTLLHNSRKLRGHGLTAKCVIMARGRWVV